MSDEGLSLPELVEFYDARDLFLGLAGGTIRADHRLVEGFWRLQKSKHSEAQYVCSLFSDGPPVSYTTAFETLYRHGGLVGFCYAGILYRRMDMIKQAAELGHPLALGYVAMEGWSWNDGDTVEWAQRAADAGDRLGMYILANCLWYDEYATTNDNKEALQLYHQSARLGDLDGMIQYGQLKFCKFEAKRYYWLGRAAGKSQEWGRVLYEAGKHVQFYNGQSAEVLLMIGRVIKKWKRSTMAPEKEAVATNAVRLYDTCIARARNAVLCWLQCASKVGLYKDVARLIAQEVWSSRHVFMVVEH